MIQPVVIASKNGMQRFTVIALSVTETIFWSNAGNLRNHAGRTVFAGTGGAITPSSLGSHMNRITGLGRSLKIMVIASLQWS
jgi:hypothetical protein